MQAHNDEEFDLARNDKVYILKIPQYIHSGDTVLYEIKLKDLVLNKQYTHNFRFKQLKEFYEQLQPLGLQLPEFPKTHFWKKTNKNPQMIQERKNKLEVFFNIVVNDPFTRGSDCMKKFIRICKFGDRNFKKAQSLQRDEKVQKLQKAKSLDARTTELTISPKKKIKQ